MATRFEIVLYGENESSLRGAGEEALQEVERLEAQLSLYRSSSELAGLNQTAARRPVRVEPGLFRLLEKAARLSRETTGAFDITVGPLMRCWGFMGGSGSWADPAQLEQARQIVGMDLVEFNEADFTIRFRKPGVRLDLGAIGKGYALDRAAEILLEAGVTSAFLHGGSSTAYGIGKPPDAENWRVAIEYPDRAGERLEPKAFVALENRALSVSAVWGKSFEHDGRTYGHVLDPRSGLPVEGAMLAAVICPSGTDSDALSTALLTLGKEGQALLQVQRPDLESLVLARTDDGQPEIHASGRSWQTNLPRNAS